MLTTLKPISLTAQETSDEAFTRQLMASFMETGFAVIKDHGLDQSVIDRAYEVSRDFFALPLDTKTEYFDPAGAGQRGYTPFGTENAKGVQAIDLKEFWHTGRDLPADHPYWSHPKVTITPHMASLTVPNSSTEWYVKNIERMERGEAPLNTVDRGTRY